MIAAPLQRGLPPALGFSTSPCDAVTNGKVRRESPDAACTGTHARDRGNARVLHKQQPLREVILDDGPDLVPNLEVTRDLSCRWYFAYLRHGVVSAPIAPSGGLPGPIRLKENEGTRWLSQDSASPAPEHLCHPGRRIPLSYSGNPLSMYMA
jgi:hypothetical protein